MSNEKRPNLSEVQIFLNQYCKINTIYKNSKLIVKKWNCEKVNQWMKNLNLTNDYSSMIINEGIDGEALLEMTEEKWKELGVIETKDINKLVNIIKNLQ
jgi:hypothetical protein